jgi:hypothetical protein
VFVSDEIVTHMGKTAGAEERLQKHVGGLLVPPYEPERLQQLQLLPRTAMVEGDSWQEHSKDIAVAGRPLISCVCVWGGMNWSVNWFTGTGSQDGAHRGFGGRVSGADSATLSLSACTRRGWGCWCRLMSQKGGWQLVC